MALYADEQMYDTFDYVLATEKMLAITRFSVH